MQTDYIDLIEQTPTIHTKRCKIIAFTVRIFLQFTTFVVGLIVWYLYDYFIAIASLLLSYIIMGIIRSKIRNSVIPPNQLEYQYNDKAIAEWFVAKELCYEDDSTQNLA